MPRYRIGVDVGGTHTDLVLYDVTTSAVLVEKVASTPSNPADGVLNGIANFIRAGIDPAEIDFFAHGTTITTNALLEMRGAKVGLLITKGYRAVQEIQNQGRDGNLFDYFYQKPAPIAPQSLTREIAERTDYLGNVLVALDRDAVRRAAIELEAAGVQSIAVCYLFSFMNPAHEQDTRTIVTSQSPGIHVSLSSDVLPAGRSPTSVGSTVMRPWVIERAWFSPSAACAIMARNLASRRASSSGAADRRSTSIHTSFGIALMDVPPPTTLTL